MKTVDDVLRDMRRGMIPKHRHDRELMMNFADHIEKAIEVERNEWRKMLKEAKDVIGVLEERCDAVEQCQTEEAICEKSSQVGNAANIIEVLKNIKQEAETTCEYMDYPIAGSPGERGTCLVVPADWIIDECNAALAKPPRNCDMGTAREQDLRFDDFCNSHKGCDKCPLKETPEECVFGWAHLPYGKEGKA